MKWLLVVLVVGFIAIVFYRSAQVHEACEKYGRETGQVTKYRERVGCLIQRGDVWMIKQ